MKIIGITGPIGAGKTYVTSLMSKRVKACIDSDVVYHTLISQPSECTEKIREFFGDSVIDKKGGVDRKSLGEMVFCDKEKLNEITHVCVGKRVNEILSEFEAKGEKAVLIEVPLMFESGFDKMCDAVVCVTADREIRLERIMRRSGLSESEAELRVNSQKSEEFYTQSSDYVIYSTDQDDLIQQIDNVLDRILKNN